MRLHRNAAFIAVPGLILGGLLFTWAQNPAPQAAQAPAASYSAEITQQDLAIQKENLANSELMKNEEYLTTEIGPRLTFGKEMQAAAVWTVQRFKDYGLENVHNEDIPSGTAWYPGVDTAEMIAPWHKELVIHSEAFSPTTCPAGVSITNPDGTENPKCEITAQVMLIEPGTTPTPEEVKGKIIMQGAPPPFQPLDADDKADNAYEAVKGPVGGGGRGAGGARGAAAAPAAAGTATADAATAAGRGAAAAGRGAAARGGGGRGAGGASLEGAVAVLRDGGKYWGLMTAGSVGGRGGAGTTTPPTAVMPNEDYALLYRMLHDYHNTVTLKIALRGSLSAAPEKASITVAQIKGIEKPDEQVILGGHLDSWYLGQGAVDNGTGAMATLEAARILNTMVKTQGWKPRRTLTFILFTNEENGGAGVRTFITNHVAEMPKVDAVLVNDTGTGKFLSISIDGFWETGKQINEVYTPLRSVFAMSPLDSRTYGSSDHVAFEAYGIPAYFGVQAEAGYGAEHHTNADTFDKVIPDQANQTAAVTAAWMWNVSQLDEFFPRHAVTAGAAGARGAGGPLR